MSMFHRVLLSITLLLASLLRAEEAPGTDDDLPQPFDPGFADQLLAHSPFTRIVNLEDTFQLTGIAYVDGRPVATLLNKATQERLTVSDEPNAQGWKIRDAIPGDDLHDTEVHLVIGTEEITMHYGDAQLTPGASKKGVPGVYVPRPTNGPAMAGSSNAYPVRTSSLLGENGRELYASLSREGRDKLRDTVRSYMEKHPERTMEQNSAYAQKIYSKIKAADQKSPSSGTSTTREKNPKSNSKPGKPNKSK